jgi:hypothetical protein
MPNVLAIYKGHFVDVRLKQFHWFDPKKLPSIIPFDSPTGRQWLKEIQEQNINIASVPADSEEGQKRMKQWEEMLYGKKPVKRARGIK